MNNSQLKYIKSLNRSKSRKELGVFFIEGKRLIESGQIDLGKMLIARGLSHDNSKFFGAEWDNMSPIQSINEDKEKSKLKLAIHHHNSTNLHHPEAWPKGHRDNPNPRLRQRRGRSTCCPRRVRPRTCPGTRLAGTSAAPG